MSVPPVSGGVRSSKKSGTEAPLSSNPTIIYCYYTIEKKKTQGGSGIFFKADPGKPMPFSEEPCHCEPVRRLAWQSVLSNLLDTDSRGSDIGHCLGMTGFISVKGIPLKTSCFPGSAKAVSPRRNRSRRKAGRRQWRLDRPGTGTDSSPPPGLSCPDR